MIKPKIVLPIIGLLLFIGSAVVSLPRLSAEHATACVSCHISPTGGGMRNEFGNYSVALNELCLPQTKKKFVENYHSPRLSEALTVGFDLRYLVFDDGRTFRMQTDGYLNFEPMKDANLHFRFGEDPFGEASIFEAYGMYRFDHKKYFIKIGRFTPVYGLHNDDHNSYSRARTGNGPNLYLDGVAIGGDFSLFNASVEVYGVNQQNAWTGHIYRVGTAGPFGYLAGLSTRFSEEINGSNLTLPHSRAIFGGLNYDRFTLMGEYDLVGQSSDTMISYAQFTTRLEYGLYLVGEYNFLDHDRHLENGVEEFYRFSLELYPIPFFLLRPSYTIYTEGPLKDEEDFFVQLHFGY